MSEIFERLALASPANVDPAELREARKWVHGYQRKFGPQPNAHRPDDQMLAQLLSIATLDQVRTLILELMHEAQPAGDTYTWYILRAIERIHNLTLRTDPDFVRKRLTLHQGGAAKLPR